MSKYETKGWICPKCGRVYAPWVDKCQYCGGSTITCTSPTCPYWTAPNYSNTTWACSNTTDKSTANINSTLNNEVKC